jgi:predicted AlkP superfamily pyrophosphatase or phosphodiesterase
VTRARTAGRFLAALALALCSLGGNARAAERSAASPQPVVILLSWDGTRYDYPDRVKTQALARMQLEGARAAYLLPVFPSSTFPNHVSLATGTYPDRHGVIENHFTDRQGRTFDYANDASWIEAEPLWVTAERQGVRAAVYFWVGSESAWHGRAASYSIAPFDSAASEPKKVEQILAWLDLPAGERPGLIMSWWHGCDGVGHAHGPNDPAIATQLRSQDRALAQLFVGLDERKAWSYTTVLVASDHGMSEITGVTDVQSVLDGAGIAGRVEYGGGEAQVYLRNPAQRDAALAAFASQSGLEAYASDRLPGRLRSYFAGRSGDLTLLGEPPNVLGRSSAQQRLSGIWAWLRGKRIGAHGFDPGAYTDMRAIFFALGRGVARGQSLGEVRTIDVAPTAAALLGIAPPEQSEGRDVLQAASKSDAKP